MAEKYESTLFPQNIVPERPSTLEVIGLSSLTTFEPVVRSIYNDLQHGQTRDPKFDWRKGIEGYEEFATSLSTARNSQHQAAIKKQIDDSLARRQTLSEATLGQQFLGGLFDPVNLVALPFGGPTVGLLRSVGRGALTAGITQAGIEGAIVQPFDPVATAEESAANIAGTMLFGGAIGGALSIPLTRAASVHAKTQDRLREFSEISTRIENLRGMTPEAFSARQPREERVYGQLPDEEINRAVADLSGQAKALRDQAENGDLGQDLRDRADAIDAEAMAYRNELGLRTLEAEGLDLTDPYRILPSKFTDSFMFKMISTPMKRALQSDYPSAVKEKFVKLANDSGITLLMNSYGIAAGPSVYQRTAVDFGKVVKAHDTLTKLWADDTNASTRSLIDLNASDLARRAARDPNTYGRWLETVSEKRMKGITDMTENELKAASVINDYFENAAKELEDVGLLGTPKGMANRINQMQAEIDSLNAQVKSMNPQRQVRQISLALSRVKKLEDEVKFRQMELDASTEVKVSEPFFPRFYDQGAIKANRKEFSDILFNWYQQNPFVWDFNYKTGQWEKTELSTDPAAIRQRAESTIDNILGESDPVALENVSFGVGRSKHFRQRQLDIPNSLITKFIVRDPLAAMKTYAARIEPRRNFQSQFGKDYDGVLFDMEMSMLNAGKDEAAVNAARKDFDALYRRVAGATIDDPSALSQRVAFFLREAASFAYMGGAGIAALPDFGRIVMEYDLENIVKGVQLTVDRTTLNMAVDEVRYAGEAVDILKQSAHMRIQEDISSNFQSSPLLNSARNAFYILNGLAPMTSMAKQLAGIVDAHTIIDYSIKLTNGKLDEQSRTWLARYGIDEEYAKLIAKAPWQRTDNGLYMANVDEWTDSIFIPEIEGKRITVIETKDDGKPVGKTRNGRYIPAFYNDTSKIINFDRDYIEGPMFEEKAWLNPKVEGVKAMPDIFKTPRQWANFVMLHEIMHTRFRPEDVAVEAAPTPTPEINWNTMKSGDFVTLYRGENQDNISNGDWWTTDPKKAAQYGALRSFSVKADDLGKVSVQGHGGIDEFYFPNGVPSSFTKPKKVKPSPAEYENRINELALTEYRSQTAINADAVDRFRTALNSGVLNTIMSGTPADKPIITDGVAYIPIRIAKQFGMKEDPRIKGYARIENGFMGLPFQFYSFLLASLNKTVGAFAHGQIKNRALGSAVMLGLAYLSLKIRTPDYVWEDMSVQDKMARTIDMSGLLSIYSDMFYTSMHTSLALGGPNITGGFLQPKFRQEQSVGDAITGFAGAGPSWAKDMLSGVYSFASGDYGEGAREIVRNLPGSNLWFLKSEVNQITRGWVN